MPRVGSSSTSTSTSWCSSRATATFCWLPPDSSPTLCADPRSGSRADRSRRAPPRAAATAATSAAGPERLEPRQRQVVGDGQAEREPFARRGPRSACPCPGASARAARRPGVRRRRVRVRCDRLEPENRAQQPRPPGAEQPGDAEDLAAMQRQRRGARRRAPSTSQDRLAGASRRCADRDRPARGRPSARRCRRALRRGGRRRRPRCGRRAARRSGRRPSFTSSMKCEM